MACGFTFCSYLLCVRVPAGDSRPRNRSQRARLRCYLGGMRRAPSRRMTSPLSIVFSTMWSASAAYSSGRPRRGGNGTWRAERVARLLGQAGQQRRVEQARGDRAHADAGLGEVARGGERHADDAALGGRVGDLADLAVVGGDRGGVDAHAALALVVGLVGRASRAAARRSTLKRADQVDADHASRTARGCAGRCAPAIFSAQPMPGAADADPQRRPRRRRARPRPRPASASVTSVATKLAPSSSASAAPALGVEVGDRDVGAGRVQRGARWRRRGPTPRRRRARSLPRYPSARRTLAQAGGAGRAERSRPARRCRSNLALEADAGCAAVDLKLKVARYSQVRVSDARVRGDHLGAALGGERDRAGAALRRRDRRRARSSVPVSAEGVGRACGRGSGCSESAEPAA